MSLRRVSVSIALVAVLASSLFSGWLVGSSTILKPPVAHAQTVDDYQNWFFRTEMDTNTIGITINKNPDTPGNSPYVEVPVGITGGPKNSLPIRFKLTFVKGNGTIGTLNADWLIYQGYQVGNDGSEIILPNLYLLNNDNRESIVVYSTSTPNNLVDQFSTTSKILATSRIGDLSSLIGAPEGKFYVKENDIRELFRYLFNAPKKGGQQDCAGLGTTDLVITGPKKVPPILESSELETTNGLSIGDFALVLNGNCLNTAGDGWLRHWGISFDSDPLEAAQCGIRAIVKGGIGDIVIRIIACVAQTIVGGVGGAIDGNNPNSPLRSVACISYIPYIFVGVAKAQSEERVNCKTNNSTGSLGSLETELSLTGGKDSAGNILQESSIHKVWKVSMAVVNVVVILALLAIAFANIFHLNINTYAAKKALPGLVIGVVGANASWLLARFLVDVTGAVSIWAASIGTHGGGITSLIIWDFPIAIGRALLPLIETVILAVLGTSLFIGGLPLTIALLVALIAFLYYAFLIIAFIIALFKRIIILYFLIMVAPLAFVAYGIPNFQQYFFKWWDNFLRFLFVFPIILFGMAATVILTDTVGTKDLANPLYAFTAPGFTTIILILAAGTMVLKLPKIVTKGALDTAAGFKRLIGMAPGIMATGQWARGGIQSLRMKNIESERQRLRTAYKASAPGSAARKDLRDKWKENRAKNISAIGSGKVWDKRWNTGRGFANVFGRPQETAQAWYQDRLDAAKSKDMLESSKLTTPGGQNISDLVMGADAAFKKQRARLMGPDELGAVRAPAQWQAWVKGQPKIEGVAFENHVKKLLAYADNLGDVKGQEFIGGLGNAKTTDDATKYLKQAGFDTKSLAAVTQAGLVGAANNSMTISGRPGVLGTAAKWIRWKGVVGLPIGTPPTGNGSVGSGGGSTPPGGSAGGGPSTPPGPSSGGGSGVGTAPTTTYDPGRGKKAAAEVSFIRADIDESIKSSIHSIASEWGEALKQLEEPGLDSAEIAAAQVQLADLRNRSFDALSNSLINGGEDILSGFNEASHENIQQMVENISAGLTQGIHGENFDANAEAKLNAELSKRYAVSEAATAAKLDLTARIDSGELARILQQQGEQMVQSLAGVITPSLDAVAKSANKPLDPKIADTITSALAVELGRFGQMISGPDRKSLRSSVNNAIDRAVSEMGEKQINISSIAAAIRATQPAPTSSTTNINNIEQSTTVGSPAPVAPIPPTPQTDNQPSSEQPPGPNSAG